MSDHPINMSATTSSYEMRESHNSVPETGRSTRSSTHPTEINPPPDFVVIRRYRLISDVPYIRDHETRSFTGAYGTVFRATLSSGRLFASGERAFAVKEIHASTSTARLEVEREIKHLNMFKHKNILRLVEAYMVDTEGLANTLFLVTSPWAPVSLQRFFEDLANSSNLESRLCPWYLSDSIQPWDSIIQQCVDGLQYLHHHSIRHKDLKPHNILLLDESSGDYERPRIRPIIADLGISKQYIVGGQTSFRGTYEYLAPEQITQIESTPKSDVFSLGCCFAMIQAVVFSGKDGLLALEDAALGSNSCQFASNLIGIRRALEEMCRCVPLDNNSKKGMFNSTLRAVVREMLREEPTIRPSAAEIQGLFLRHMELEEQLDCCDTTNISRYLQICVPARRNNYSLFELNISHVTDDEALIDAIRKGYYDAMRSSIGWAYMIWEPAALEFLQFSVEEKFVTPLYAPSLPSEQSIRNRQYLCEVNQARSSPMSSELFIYLFHKKRISTPRRRLPSTKWLRRFPQKLGPSIQKENGENAIEWGILIRPTLHINLVLGSLLVAISYSIMAGATLGHFRHDTTEGVLTSLLVFLLFIAFTAWWWFSYGRLH